MRPGTPEPAPPGTGCDPARPNRRRPARRGGAPCGTAASRASTPRGNRHRRRTRRYGRNRRAGRLRRPGRVGVYGAGGGAVRQVRHRRPPPRTRITGRQGNGLHTPPSAGAGQTPSRANAPRGNRHRRRKGARTANAHPPARGMGVRPGTESPDKAGRRPVKHPARTRPRSAPRVTAPETAGDLRAAGPPDLEAARPRGRQAARPPGREAARPRGRQAARPPGREAARPRGRQAARPPGREAARPRGRQAARPPGREAARPRGRRAARAARPRGPRGPPGRRARAEGRRAVRPQGRRAAGLTASGRSRPVPG